MSTLYEANPLITDPESIASVGGELLFIVVLIIELQGLS